MGKDSWEPLVAGPASRELASLSQEISISARSLATDRVENIAVTTMRPSVSSGRANESIEVTARVENFGSVDAKQIPIQFSVDGNTIESKEIDVAAGSSVLAHFTLTPRAAGLTVLSVSIPDDSLAADSSRQHVIHVRNQNQILFIEDQDGDANLMRMSLAPPTDENRRDRFVSVSPYDISAIDLADWDLLVLSDVRSIQTDAYTKLVRFVQQGGGVFAAFGPNTSAPQWNKLSEQSDILGFRFRSPSKSGDWRIDPLDYASPVAAPFSGFPDSGLLTTPIFRYWQINASTAGYDAVDLAFSHGEPLVVRKNVQRGSVASILSAPSAGLGSASQSSWNAIAAWPSFVPMMQQLAQVMLDRQAAENNVLSGMPLTGIVANDGDPSRIEISRPDGTDSQLLVGDQTEVGGNRQWLYDETEMRGIYLATDPQGNVTPYAVNIDPVECRLESVPTSSLPLRAETEPAADETFTSARPPVDPQILPRILLGLLLVLLVTESLLAWIVGRRIG